jgi:hypothetical protein
MPSAGPEPAIPTGKQPQAHAIDQTLATSTMLNSIKDQMIVITYNQIMIFIIFTG